MELKDGVEKKILDTRRTDVRDAGVSSHQRNRNVVGRPEGGAKEYPMILSCHGNSAGRPCLRESDIPEDPNAWDTACQL